MCKLIPSRLLDGQLYNYTDVPSLLQENTRECITAMYRLYMYMHTLLRALAVRIPARDRERAQTTFVVITHTRVDIVADVCGCGSLA